MILALNALEFYLLIFSNEKGVIFFVFGYCTMIIIMKKQKHKSKKEDISFPNIGPIIELKRKSTRQSLLINKINESLSLKWA
jgi:hypothetical protein